MNNDCTVEGIEQEIFRFARHEQLSQTEAYAKYIGELRQAINGAIHPTITLNCKLVNTAGHTVLLLTIPEGEEKPYAQFPSNAIYVRHGGNNTHPSTEELRELLKEKNVNLFDR